MLDIKLIRENPDLVRAALRDRGDKRADLDRILALDRERRDIQKRVDDLGHERKVLSKEIPEIKKTGGDAAAKMARSKATGEELKQAEARLREVETEQDGLLRWVPNVPLAEVPRGADAAANVVVRRWGERRTFPFAPKNHIELAEPLGILEVEGGRGVKVAGSSFALFKGAGARLVRALINFMADLHGREHGYVEIWPPALVNRQTLYGTGQLPKLEEDMYHVEADDLFLIPTAEVPVTNLHRDEIIDRKELPIRYVAYTPCFRREAGAFGKDTKGLMRLHQFDKVELVKIVEPETSPAEHESLLQNAESVLRRLDLEYRVLLLCTGDMGFSAAKCYDLECWAPGTGRWFEVSSVSSFTDFQARRANIRYRAADGKPRFAHTLNGSGLALPRVILCLLESLQRADGSVAIPEPLRPYLGGQESIEPARPAASPAAR